MPEIKKEEKTGIIEGVLVYAKIAQADKKYQSEDKEYSIGILVNEDTADEWDTKFKKQPAKKVKATDFQTKYKFENPLEGKYVYEIRLKKDAVVDGKDVFPEYRPKVLLDTKEGTRVDITESRLIANGSVGKVSYRISSNDFGTFARLSNVLVNEETFKEFVSEFKGAGSEFGDKEITKEAPRKEVTEARKEKPKKTAPPPEDDEDINDPFD